MSDQHPDYPTEPGGPNRLVETVQPITPVTDPEETRTVEPGLTVVATEVAKPGPHPHESEDIRLQGGNVAGWRDPMHGFGERRFSDQPE